MGFLFKLPLCRCVRQRSGSGSHRYNQESWNSKPVVLTSWLGGAGAVEPRRLFAENLIPTYETPTDAVRAFMQVIKYQQNQEMLMETPRSIPESFTPDMPKARHAIDQALTEGRGWLTVSEAYAVLDAFTIPAAPLEAWRPRAPTATRRHP